MLPSSELVIRPIFSGSCHDLMPSQPIFKRTQIRRCAGERLAQHIAFIYQLPPGTGLRNDQ